MKKPEIILVLILAMVVYNCSKDKHNPDPGFCETTPDLQWTQTLTKDSITGKWMIYHIDYRKYTGTSTLFDTSYNPSAKLVLNADGTGTLNLSPIKWSLTTKVNYMPALSFTNMDTLFPFPVNIIHGDSLVTYIQLPPKIKFFVIAGLGGSGIGEESYISFERE